MHQEQQDTSARTSFTIMFAILLALQRAFTVPLHSMWGTQALGVPCLLCLGLLFGWSALSRDPFMWVYTILWFLFFAQRRIQALWYRKNIHSWDEGTSALCKNQPVARLIVEPGLVMVMGLIALWYYQQQEWAPHGLPYFLIGGAVVMIAVETFRKQAWLRKLEGLRDARLEQQQVMEDFHQNWR
jgi:hypothetical protein